MAAAAATVQSKALLGMVVVPSEARAVGSEVANWAAAESAAVASAAVARVAAARAAVAMVEAMAAAVTAASAAGR